MVVIGCYCLYHQPLEFSSLGPSKPDVLYDRERERDIEGSYPSMFLEVFLIPFDT